MIVEKRISKVRCSHITILTTWLHFTFMFFTYICCLLLDDFQKINLVRSCSFLLTFRIGLMWDGPTHFLEGLVFWWIDIKDYFYISVQPFLYISWKCSIKAPVPWGDLIKVCMYLIWYCNCLKFQSDWATTICLKKSFLSVATHFVYWVKFTSDQLSAIKRSTTTKPYQKYVAHDEKSNCFFLWIKGVSF